ncbi:MAG: Zn-dependent protease [candidate division Zixibacteria bacterium RBG_16_43_9]|nr:MAG: Zn-dependent protease [candidate division Zixibacteria bacterium RBG_16_43_9]
MNHKKVVLTALILLLCTTLSNAQELKSYPCHTYSIVARDSVTGEMGVAVQSHYFSVGPVVPWAEAGVGAVATQSLVDVTYGPLGLDLMRAGRTAQDALKALLAGDKNNAVRQVAMIDASGNVAAHTGDKCIPAAGHIVGKNYSVQANLMLDDKVWPAMAKAFENTKGSLTERMLAALDAAQAEGGDIRGKQSAAILIVKGKSTGKPWQDKVLDLRVEDNPEPLKELRRLVKIAEAYHHSDLGDLALEKKDLKTALKEYAEAKRLYPESIELKFWEATALVNNGRVKESLPIFKEIFEKEPIWKELVKRLPQVDMLPKDEKVIKKILDVTK